MKLKRSMKQALKMVPCLLALYVAPGQAQLINQTVGQLNTVTRQVDDTARRIERQTQRQLEQVKPKVDQLTQATTQTVTQTATKLTDSVTKLPEQLPILDKKGQPAFIEVQVENGARAVQREWLASLDESELASLQKLPVEIVETTRFDELAVTMVRFRVPPELDSMAALRKQIPNIAAKLDRNHIYAPQAGSDQAATGTTSQSVCNEPVKVGVIDTAIKLDHPAFKGQTINARNFLEQNLAEPDAHGTAVAGLLVGQGEQLVPLVPKASLYAASVFYARNDFAQGATMMNLVRALNWLTSENVSVINMSLAGPDNQILATVIAKTIAKGKTIVAAAGNEGPAAPPLYPAAYEGVIAVTAVDKDQKVYRWANRGPHISFAAPGVSVLTARSSGGTGKESGTSMATPVVTAFLACELQKNNTPTAIANLSKRALDLGEPGRDAIFGYGLLTPARP